MADTTIKVLVCCTGSAIELISIVESMLKTNVTTYGRKGYTFNFEVKVILTEKARHFCNDKDHWPFENVQTYSDEEEWSSWKERGDPVMHINLTKWAEVLLIAPLDANTLAKIANGICNNMVTCAIRAWDLSKPLLFCPAMNTKMWEHPITAQHINILKNWGYHEVPCVSKVLMYGDVVLGKMAPPRIITNAVVNHSVPIIENKQKTLKRKF